MSTRDNGKLALQKVLKNSKNIDVYRKLYK